MYLVSPRLPSAPHHIEMRSLCYSRFCRAECACPSKTPYLFPPFFPLATVSSFSTSVSLFLNLNFILEYSWFWRRQWHPTPVLLPGKSHGRRSLVGCSPWSLEESDWSTSLSLFIFMHWRRKWQPTPVFLPEESQGLGSLVGCCLWGRTESDTTEAT